MRTTPVQAKQPGPDVRQLRGMTMVKAILFDVFGTIVDWRTSLIDDLSAWGGSRPVDWTGLVDAWRHAYAPSMDEVRRGVVPWMNLDALHRRTLERIGPDFGLAGLTEAEWDHVNRGWHRLRPWPDSVPGLQALRTRYILSPLSNGNVSLLVNMARNAGLPWDLVLCAEVFGHYKPDPEVYLGACRLLSLEPQEVMLCAAHNGDLAAAQKLGLATAFIPRPTEYGPHQTRDFAAEGQWDFVAADLEALAVALPGSREQ